ncbi:type II toxin-antitoxin system prevent-host-death family antitoxin, partial [Sulfobacillus acidophilus]|nr:type II toxin-antitoxin system prevent-host-death family antitoxin [Sulfobacillus acidophilus]
MAITASKLRQDIFRILDSVLETGEPIEINRKGQIIRLIPERKPKKLQNLKKRKFSDEPLENFIHI